LHRRSIYIGAHDSEPRRRDAVREAELARFHRVRVVRVRAVLALRDVIAAVRLVRGPSSGHR